MIPEAISDEIKSFIRVTSALLSGWSAVGFSYILKSLIGFLDLAILYVFVPIHTLQIPIRNLLSHLLTLISLENFESLFLRKSVGLYENTDFLYFVPERMKNSYSGIKWIGSFSYKENFIANFW